LPAIDYLQHGLQILPESVPTILLIDGILNFLKLHTM
jgi:hypothetical protein